MTHWREDPEDYHPADFAELDEHRLEMKMEALMDELLEECRKAVRKVDECTFASAFDRLELLKRIMSSIPSETRIEELLGLDC